MFQGVSLPLDRWCAVGAVLLASLLGLATAPVASAQSDDEEGCGCHSAERDAWEMSTHGQILASGEPVAACETCHGAYTREHRDGGGMIPLSTDSSVCIECHESIAHNWEETIHAEAGVQCISCHLAHSQDLRLSDEMLCESCHRDTLEDSLHTAHWVGDVTCTNCHMADQAVTAGEQIAAADPALAVLAMTAPRHDFVAVAGDNCLDCHAKEVKAATTGVDEEYSQRLDLIAAAAEAPVLRAQLSEAEQASRTTTFFVPMSLGFGVSIGGMLGIAFVLMAARWGRKGGL